MTALLFKDGTPGSSALRFALDFLRVRRGSAAFVPTRITAILTEHCHLRCAFCQLWQAPRAGASNEEWLALFKANPHLSWVNLTGGELFARDRLDALLEGLVAQLPRLFLLDFPTAGQKPDAVVATARALLATRLQRLVVTVSIDGGPALHDELRGVPGAFERALETLACLREMRSRRFEVRVGCTLTARARLQVETLRRELRRRIPGFHDREIHFNLAHTSTHYYKNDTFAELPGDDALDVLEENARFGLSPVAWVEWLYARLARRALSEQHPPMGCESLRRTVFVGPDLSVYPCSIWDRPLGNLRDHGFSLERLLGSELARSTRTTIDARACPGCMTPCEAVPALLAHPLRSTALALWGARGFQANRAQPVAHSAER